MNIILSMNIKSFQYLSTVCAIALLYVVLHFGMLPTLIALCVSFILASWLTKTALMAKAGKYNVKLSAALIGLIPFLLLAGLVFGANSAAGSLQSEFAGLIAKLADMLETWKNWLPQSMADKVSDDTALKQLLVGELQARAGAIASVGKVWAIGMLQVIIGTIIGVLIFADKANESKGALGVQVYARAHLFIETFRRIVTAQFFIALVNTTSTAIYLFAVLPLAGVEMPYRTALTVLTLVASMLPVVGNLITNSILTLVSLSISPAVAIGTLCFMVLVHKSEYFVGAAALSGKTETSVWELLIAIFLGEAIFGVAGLVAAPLYYAYIKQELKNTGLA